MHKKFLRLLPVAALLLAACTAEVPSGDNESSSSSSSAASISVMDDESSSSVAATSSVTSSVPSDAPSAPHLIQIHMKNWEFTPMTVTVRKGENVQLQLIGDEGIHGFAVPDLGLNVRLEAGKTVTVDLDTSVAGTFEGFCSIPCGPGHKEMKVTIIVTE